MFCSPIHSTCLDYEYKPPHCCSIGTTLYSIKIPDNNWSRPQILPMDTPSSRHSQLAFDTYVNSSKKSRPHSPGPRTRHHKHNFPTTVVQSTGSTGFVTVHHRKKSRSNQKFQPHRYQVALPPEYQDKEYVHFSRRPPSEYKRLKRQRTQNNTFFSRARHLPPSPSSLTRQTDPNMSRKVNFGELCLNMLDHRVEDDAVQIVENSPMSSSTRLVDWEGLDSPARSPLHRSMSSNELNFLRPMTATLRRKSSASSFQFVNKNTGQQQRRPLSASASGRALRTVHTSGPKLWAPRHHHPQILGGLTIQTSKGRRKISKVIKHIPSHRSPTNAVRRTSNGFVSPISTRNVPQYAVNITRGMVLMHQGV